ncbi:MAG: hypothetical protein IH594_09185 [Bacteroidales bacterium]|nr:hypothetical protein [Bacteroidales bacterium]
MFLGIFTSIIPYLIAAGFYAAWILFSLVQPYLSQKKNPEPLNETSKILTIDASHEKDPTANTFHYEEHFQVEIQSPAIIPSYHAGCFSFPFVESGIIPPDRQGQFNLQFILSGHFSRPPPIC